MDFKKLFTRAFDLAVIAALLLGSGRLYEFATYLVWVMAGVAVFGMLVMDQPTAQEVHGTLGRRLVAWSFNLAYTAALVASDSPVLAAVYLSAVVCLRVTAQAMATKPEVAS